MNNRKKKINNNINIYKIGKIEISISYNTKIITYIIHINFYLNNKIL